MSCPNCNGFVSYHGEPTAVKVDNSAIYLYFHAQCDDCDWTGTGVEIFPRTEDFDYIDGTELPDKAEGYYPQEEE